MATWTLLNASHRLQGTEIPSSQTGNGWIPWRPDCTHHNTHLLLTFCNEGTLFAYKIMAHTLAFSTESAHEKTPRPQYQKSIDFERSASSTNRGLHSRQAWHLLSPSLSFSLARWQLSGVGFVDSSEVLAQIRELCYNLMIYLHPCW